MHSTYNLLPRSRHRSRSHRVLLHPQCTPRGITIRCWLRRCDYCTYTHRGYRCADHLHHANDLLRYTRARIDPLAG